MKTEKSPLWITQKEASELLGETLKAIHGLTTKGRLRSKEMYGKRLVRREDVLNYEPKKQADQEKKLLKIEDKIMQIENNNSNFPPRQSRSSQSKRSKLFTPRATKKYRRNPDNAGTLRLFNFPSSFNVWQENDRKFDEFMQNRPSEFVENKMPVSLFSRNQAYLLYGLPYGMNSNFKLPSFPLFQTKKYNDPINEAIHQHYKQKLRNISNLNLMKEINDFLKSYFFKSQKSKKREAKKDTIKQIIGMAGRGLNAAQITNEFAKVELERLIADFSAEGHTKERAKFMASENMKDWKIKTGNSIREALCYHGFAKRNKKTAEKLMPNFSGKEK